MIKKTDLIVVGAGNPDIIKLIETINDYFNIYNFIGLLEKDVSLHGKKINGHEILGDDELLKTEFRNCAVVNNVCVSPKIRSEITNNLKNNFGITNFPNLIHPQINLKYFNSGIGNIIYENVSLGANVEIGDFNIIFYGSVLGHETKIGDCNLFGGNVTVGARCNINNRNYFSNSCTIKNNLEICDDVFIGIGSVVMQSVAQPKKLVGNPARALPF